MKNVFFTFALVLFFASCTPSEPVNARQNELDSIQLQKLNDKERKIKEPLFALSEYEQKEELLAINF